MKWRMDHARKLATTAEGYEIRWANSQHGDFFNAWAPIGTHLAAGYGEKGKADCKAACEAHSKQGELALS